MFIDIYVWDAGETIHTKQITDLSSFYFKSLKKLASL